MKHLASGTSSTRAVIHWNTLRGSISVIVFLILVIIAEVLVVLYAMALGVTDTGAWTTDWPVKITISPMFDLVPIAVIITLLCTWIYLTKQLSFRPVPQVGKPEVKQPYRRGQPTKREIEKTKSSPESPRSSISTWQRISSMATIKSAVIVLIAFTVLILIISQLVYPGAIYQAITSSYQSHSALYGFVTSVGKGLAGFTRAVGLGGVAAAINNALVSVAPGIRAIGSAFGSSIESLSSLDAAGKYLAVQNVAAWISVLLVLLYAYHSRRISRFKKK